MTTSLRDSLLSDVDRDERHLLYFPGLCNHHVDPNGTEFSKPESTCGIVCSLIQPFHFIGEKMGPFSGSEESPTLALDPGTHFFTLDVLDTLMAPRTVLVLEGGIIERAQALVEFTKKRRHFLHF